MAMKKKKSAQAKSNVHKATAAKAQAIAVQANKLLKAGPGLTPKQRKEVRGSSLSVTPGFVAAAVSAYQEYAGLLGADLDPQAAADAQSFVTEMTPVATSFRGVATALEDTVLTRKQAGAQFARAVYARLEGLARLPENAALASRVQQLATLMKHRRKKAAAAEAPLPQPVVAKSA